MQKHLKAKSPADFFLRHLSFLTQKADPDAYPKSLISMLYWVIIGLVLSYLYARLITLDPILIQDKVDLFDRLFIIDSLDHYLQTYSAGEAGYLLEDLSLLIDIYLKTQLGISTFHFTNLLIWFGILLWVNHLLRLQEIPNPLRSLVCALIALCPAFTQIVAGIGSRGILLSSFCLCAATHHLLRAAKQATSKKVEIYKAILYYLVAQLAQPIFFLWGLWATLYCTSANHSHKGLKRRAPYFLLALALPSLAIVQDISTSPLWPLWQRNFMQAPLEDLSIMFLSVCRHLVNLFVPIALYPTSSETAPINLVGVILLTLLLIPMVFLKKEPKTFPWLSFVICTGLASVFLAPIKFAAGPYLLMPGIGLFILMITIGQKRVRTLRVVLGIFLILFGYKSYLTTRLWGNENELWVKSYAKEPSKSALPYLTELYIENGKPNAPVIFALQLNEKSPQHPEFPYLFSKAVFYDTVIHFKAKPRIIEEQNHQDPWSQYYLAMSYWRLQHFERAFEIAYSTLKDISAFKSQIELVTADTFFICQQALRPNCSQVITLAQQSMPNHSWKSELFYNRLETLGYAFNPHQNPNLD